jgi:hypothetical protein
MRTIIAASLLLACAWATAAAGEATDPLATPPPVGDPVAARATAGRQEVERVARSQRIVMGRAPSGALEAICLGADDLPSLYAQGPDGAWRAVGALAQPGSAPLRALAAIPWRDQLEQVVVLGRDDGQPGIMTRTPQGRWGALEPLPAGVSAPYAALTACFAPDGSRQVIGLGRKDGQPYLISFDGSKGRWFFIGPLGTPKAVPFAALSVGAHGVGQVPLALIGRDDGQGYLVTQAKDGTWGALQALPNFNHTPLSALALASGSDGYRQLLCIGRDDGQPYLIWQDAVRGGWNFYGAMANPGHAWLSAIATAASRDGLLQALCLGRDDGRPYHLRHGHDGKWSPVAALPASPGAPFAALAAGTGRDGTLQAICLARADGLPYLFFQDQATGAWTAAGRLSVAKLPARAPGDAAAGEPVPGEPLTGGAKKSDDF